MPRVQGEITVTVVVPFEAIKRMKGLIDKFTDRPITIDSVAHDRLKFLRFESKGREDDEIRGVFHFNAWKPWQALPKPDEISEPLGILVQAALETPEPTPTPEPTKEPETEPEPTAETDPETETDEAATDEDQ